MTLPIGVFSKIFVRLEVGQALAAITAHGLSHTQFNLSCAGLPSMPDEIDQATQAAIRAQFSQHGVEMTALSGTYNMIHPEPGTRAAGLKRLQTMIKACRGLGTRMVTLCTGTRDAENMWRAHPGNRTTCAWRDLVTALEAVLPLAEENGVMLAFEPEPANVIDRPAKGRRLLDELRSPNLKVVMDAANLFHPGDLPRMLAVLSEAFDLLGSEIALAHAKDLNAAGEVVAAGKGVLDFARVVDLLQQAGYAGPLVLHSLAEEEVAGSIAFLSAILNH